MKLYAFLSASTALLAAPAALAQTQPPADGAPAGEGDHLHEEQTVEVIVTAPLRDLDLLAGTATLSGEDLVRDLRPQLGDTLARLPGVSATSFSPGASRPVIRGFQGERVRVLTDGLGSLDVSNTSADHATTIDPITAYRVEVLRGPAVLLFGSQAIGGAVNVLDRRIPRDIPDEPFHVDITGTYGTAADERSIAAGIDAPLGGNLVLHLDGSFRKTDDLEVGGFVLAPELRMEQLEIAEEELEEGHLEEAEEALELANQRGVLPNSATEQKTAGAGLAYIGSRFRLGASVGWFGSDYGVPMRPGAEHHHEEEEHDEDHEGHEEEEEHGHGDEPVTIGLEQIRADLRGELELDGFFERARLRLGWSDYEHTEYEGDEVGTVFFNEGVEGRFELVQRERGSWSGASGIQYFHRDFSAVGAEAFLPPNTTDQFGIFTLQELSAGLVDIEAAARFEHSDVKSKPLGVSRNFNAFSAALGFSHAPSRYSKVGINLSRAERAPSAEELFSDGPHIATQAYELGDPTLTKEKSWGAEAFARLDRGAFEVSATAFVSKFDDYIYQGFTGDEEDELPVIAYFQEDATYWGFEASAAARLYQRDGLRVRADLVADYVRATIDGEGPAPRIPPLRLLAGIEAQTDDFEARAEVEWADDQDRTAPLETRTDGHTLVNASLTWRPWGRRENTALILSANNIFDVDARRHASFTKDFVPLAGRDIRLSARFSF